MESRLKNQLSDRIDLHNQQREGTETGKKRVAYGTAGFRGIATEIDHIFFNVGVIAGLRSLQSRATIGIMITASHNPVQDNGVKLIDSNGEMLESHWECIVEKFCNTNDKVDMLGQLDGLFRTYGIIANNSEPKESKIFIGMDNRPSSRSLASLIKLGIDSWSPLVECINHGVLTTPALHFLVAESNKGLINRLTLQSYYDQLISGVDKFFGQEKVCNSYSACQLVVDCANGVGSETMKYLLGDKRFEQLVPSNLINTGDGILNHGCGADHVKTTKSPPVGANDTNKRYASLDGDADRVVYFYLDETGENFKLNLLDGDKIMALFAKYLSEALKYNNLDTQLSLGLVQTAYANGASTTYMIDVLKVSVDCVDTGVKNLHKRALSYDLGIYFEANGHGTIWISDKARELIGQIRENDDFELNKLFKLINNYTGDAISDILVVEAILRHYDWNVIKWFNLYKDSANSLIKIQIKNRNLVETTNAARTCVKPVGLQAMIDSIVAQYSPGARCFVRSSGTEDVVRIYAEAADQDSADRISKEISAIVTKMCNNTE